MGMNNLPTRAGSQSHPTFPAAFQNPQPLVRPQLPAQPNLNPNNNKPIQYVQILENSNNDTEPVECNELQIRSGRIISTEENNVD